MRQTRPSNVLLRHTKCAGILEIFHLHRQRYHHIIYFSHFLGTYFRLSPCREKLGADTSVMD